MCGTESPATDRTRLRTRNCPLTVGGESRCLPATPASVAGTERGLACVFGFARLGQCLSHSHWGASL